MLKNFKINGFQKMFSKERKTQIFIWATLTFFLIAPTLYIILQSRIVTGHDAFVYFALQYFFLNNVVTAYEIPQWIPFMTHGSIANWMHVIQAGFLQNILCLTGSLFKDVNFLTLFNLGFIIDETIFVIGTWYFAKRFLKHRLSLLLLSITILGSSIWMSQPWYNLHFIYCLPLILHLLHSFLETGKWRFVLLAGLLTAFQMLGNLPYFLPVITFVVFLYFLLFILCDKKTVKQTFKQLSFGLSAILTLFFIALSFICIHLALTIGTDEIVNYNFGRKVDGTITMEHFKGYAGNLGLEKWMELFIGLSPCLDYTLYIGILPIICAGYGIKHSFERKRGHFLLLLIILLLISGGTLLSNALYYIWPFMQYFRHLALMSVFIKFFLCVIAAIGFDTFLQKALSDEKNSKIKTASTLFALTLLAIATTLFVFSLQPLKTSQKIDNIVKDGLVKSGQYEHDHNKMYGWAYHDIIINNIFSPTAIKNIFQKNAIIASLLALIFLFFSHQKSIPKRYQLILFLLCLHIFDIFSYKFLNIQTKTVRINHIKDDLTRFQNTSYPKRRSTSFWRGNSRAKLIHPAIPVVGIFHWTSNLFFFHDEFDQHIRTDYWMKPFDQYIRAYAGQDIDDLTVWPKGLQFYFGWEIPTTNVSAQKISGVLEDKIQFFSEVLWFDTDKKIAKTLNDPQYQGDLLLLHQKNPPHASQMTKQSNTRIHLDYDIQQFDANNLKVSINNTTNKKIWMHYSDVWHPFWKAYLDGKEIPLYKSNLAYKAIEVPTGNHQLHMQFLNPFLNTLTILFGLISTIGLCCFIFLFKH